MNGLAYGSKLEPILSKLISLQKHLQGNL